MKTLIALLWILAISSLQASPIGIAGGEDDSTAAYAAQITTSGVLDSPLSPLPMGVNASINSVAMNNFGTSLIGGSDGPGDVYAAFVSPSGVVSPISNIPLSSGSILSVSINSSGVGLVGGFIGGGGTPYAAYISPSGIASTLSPLSGPGIDSVSINDSGFGIIGGSSGTPFTAFVSPSQVVTPLSLPVSVGIETVAINSGGNAVIGGTSSSDFYAAFVSASGVVTPLSTPVANGDITEVAINGSGSAIIAGETLASTLYAALFSFPSPSPTLITPLPALGTISGVAINSSGMGIIGGENFTGSHPYAAFVSPTGIATEISSLPAHGRITSVAINSFGVALIGGVDFANGAYLALVTPSGRAISLVNPALPDVFIDSVSILDAIPTFDTTQSLTGNNAIFADYINNFAPEKAFYFAPAFLDGTLAAALESAAPTRNAISLYTASNNLFYLTTTLATHLREQRLIGQATQNTTLATNESGDSLLASRSLQKCPIHNNEISRSYTIWFDAIGALAYQKAQNQTPAFSPATGGAILSFDAKVSEKARVGASAAYLFTHVHEKHGAGHSNINQEDLFLYASWEGSHFYADSAIGVGLFQTHQVRNIRMTGFHFKSTSNPDGWQLIPHFEFGYNGNLSKGDDIKAYYNPFIMVDWGNAWQSGYHEKGSGPFNAGQRHHYSSLLRTEVGLRLYETFFYDTWNLILEEKASYVNTESFHTGRVHAFLIGSPGAFTVTTLTSAQNLGVGQFAVTVEPHDASYPITTLFYQGEFGTMYQSHEVNVELSWNF